MKARQTRRKRKLQRGGNNNNNKWTNKTSQFQQALQKLRNAGKLFGKNTKKSMSMSKSKSKSKSNKD